MFSAEQRAAAAAAIERGVVCVRVVDVLDPRAPINTMSAHKLMQAV